MGSIFGSTSKSTSSNKAYNTINDWASNLLGYSSEGASGISSLLSGDTSGLDAYNKATGLDSAIQAGSRGITGNAAAGGLLRSGSTSKALANYSTEQQNANAQNYLGNLATLAGLGNTAAGTLTSAGQTSTSKSSNKSGLGSMIGSVGSAIALSDRRLKTNIEKVGENEDGLGIYEFYYTFNPFTKQRGVMADEVKAKRPDALGPEVGGYMSVDYSKLDLANKEV